MNWLAKRLRQGTGALLELYTAFYRQHPKMVNVVKDMSGVAGNAYLSGDNVSGSLQVGEGSAVLFCTVAKGATLRVGKNSIVMYAVVAEGVVTIGDECLVAGVNFLCTGTAEFRLGDKSILRNMCVTLNDARRSVSVGPGAVWMESMLSVALSGGMGGSDEFSRYTIGPDSTLLNGQALMLTGVRALRIGRGFTAASLPGDGLPGAIAALVQQLRTPGSVAAPTRNNHYYGINGFSVDMTGVINNAGGRVVLGDDVTVRGAWSIRCTGNFSMGSRSMLWNSSAVMHVYRRNVSIGEGAAVGRGRTSKDIASILYTGSAGRRNDLIVGDGGLFASSGDVSKAVANIEVPAGSKVM